MSRGIVLTDTHAHLHASDFDADRADVLNRAWEAGVSQIVTVGVDLADSQRALDFAHAYEGVWAAVGIHPHEAAKVEAGDLEQLRKLACDPDCVAIGETGLDYHYDYSPRAVQQEVFCMQLQMAADTGKPAILHIRDGDPARRDAFQDAFSILADFEVCGVFHCFSGGLTELEWILERGFRVSLTGVLTFGHRRGKNQGMRELLQQIPANRLMLETDCPWMSPEPFRGKRNEPSRVKEIAETAAEIRGVELSVLAAETSRTAAVFFGWEAQA